MSQIIIDVSTAPIDGADTYLDGAIAAPSNYKDEAKIAAYITEKRAERAAGAALDLDLARITGIGLGLRPSGATTIMLCKHESDERDALEELAGYLTADQQRGCQIITYNGFSFDLPMLMRRARYLGVKFPALNLDKFRSPHVDLVPVLTGNDPSRRRSLAFYIKRLGWTDLVKPLSGEEESKVHETGAWDALDASIRHDVTATYRLAVWLGIVAPASQEPLL